MLILFVAAHALAVRSYDSHFFSEWWLALNFFWWEHKEDFLWWKLTKQIIYAMNKSQLDGEHADDDGDTMLHATLKNVSARVFFGTMTTINF